MPELMATPRSDVPQVARQDWLLMFLSRTLGAETFRALDPLRIQRGMLLLSTRGPARDVYIFRDHEWGPFSPDVYDDLARLHRQNLIGAEPVTGQTWMLYSTTQRGDDIASRLLEDIHPSARDWLAALRSTLLHQPFTALLDLPLDSYPAFPVEE